MKRKAVTREEGKGGRVRRGSREEGEGKKGRESREGE